MRSRCSLLALVVSLALATPAAAASKPSCSMRASKTVASSSTARVFTVKSRKADTGNVLYGCLRSVGRRVRLAENTDDELYTYTAFSKVGLNGRFVVFQYEAADVSCKADCPPDYAPVVVSIEVADLRRRRVRGYAGVARDSLLVTPGGTPAWLQAAATAGGGADVHAGADVLDSGPVDGLTLDGHELRWTNAGAPKSATLR
jgi:hypothetical protein